MLLGGHWLRAFLFLRARAHLKLGGLSHALKDAQACLAQYDQHGLEDVQLVRCLCLQASITREMALHASKTVSAEAFKSTLEMLRKSVRIAEMLAERSGAFVPDCNVSYARPDCRRSCTASPTCTPTRRTFRWDPPSTRRSC